MVKIRNSKLLKLLIILVDILLLLVVIRECKITHFCCTIFNLISPVLIGYVIAWILKPIVNRLSKNYSYTVSTIICYFLIIVVILIFGYFLVPFIRDESKHIIPMLESIYNRIPNHVLSKIDVKQISYKLINITISVKDIILNLFYSLFISYYFLVDNKRITKFIAKYTPSKLINEISTNLRLFVKGTLLDTVILFVMTILSFKIIKMPYVLLLSLLIAITNIIPYIGPYIGGVPAILIGFTVSKSVGIYALIIVIILQFIESTFIHPIIMSKSLNIHPIIILIGLIIFGHFFGIIGMLISTPLVSIIKSLYLYYKPFKRLLKR